MLQSEINWEEYYQSDSFEEGYYDVLDEIYREEKQDVLDRIQDIWINQYNHNPFSIGDIQPPLSTEQLEFIYQYIQDNPADYTTRFYNYYVGDCCLCSVEYGEQEEQIEIDPFQNLESQLEPFSEFYINTDRISGSMQWGFYVYGYYNLSGDGLMYNLNARDIPAILAEMDRE